MQHFCDMMQGLGLRAIIPRALGLCFIMPNALSGLAQLSVLQAPLSEAEYVPNGQEHQSNLATASYKHELRFGFFL